MRPMDLCRCCLAVGCDKDISVLYEEDGRREVYSDMLLDTFNIFITYEDVGGKCQICDECIARLRDAANFKLQVVEAGKTIAQKLRAPLQIEEDVLDGPEPLPPEEIKQESYEVVLSEAISTDYQGFNINLADIEGIQDEDAIYIINLESRADGVAEMTALAENIFAARREAARRDATGHEATGREATRREATGRQATDLRPRNCYSPRPKVKPVKPDVTQSHLDMRANSLKLIRNSNMCLFKAGRAKFGCYYCFETYLNMEELREHATTHSHAKELVIKINPVTGLAFKKADISSLHCNRCLEPCEDLNALQEHLTLIHDFTFTDAGHLLIPFKLENGLRCALCDLVCNTFAFLSMHMNTHFPNYVCEVCGAAYINFKNLDIHKRIVHEKKCKKCPPEKGKCKCPDEVKLGMKPNKRTCTECNIIFRYSYLLREHHYKVHGEQRPIATCNICLKTFLTPNNLKLHVRRIHNVERNHICKVCDMSFFTAHGMKKHIRRTHTDTEVKPYSCNYCVCKFKMKYSLSKHLKNRHGRRMDGSLVYAKHQPENIQLEEYSTSDNLMIYE